ncbi:MAG: prepilin-type N-terminal cleavage/methylation domain-containing protein [Syntrophales bacterium]|nr:prepilin-type N-terminal cleavage/methylation domain-containing protein [Syntrophales bacterium]
MKREIGFTLIELTITMTVTVLLLFAVYGAVNSIQRSSAGLERKVAAQIDVKPALDLMALEISMASFNPTFTSNLWVSPTNCTSTSGNQGYKGIQEATTSTITVEMDIRGPSGGNPDGMLGDENEVIKYSYDANNQYITRTTNCGTPQPFLGDRPGNVRAVRVINGTLNIPLFRYFDGSGNEISASSLPAAIPNIRRILITLAVETEDIDPASGQRRRLIYSTSVIPRNHAIAY